MSESGFEVGPEHSSGTSDDGSSGRPGSIFISHEKNDHGLAGEIRAHLESGGFSCWMAPDDVRGPEPWPEQIAAAIDSCDVMLVIVSANSNHSPHVSREVDLALEKGKALLPVRVEDIAPTGSLDYLLRLAQWVDLFPGPIADHAAALQGMAGSMVGARSERHEAPPMTPVAEPPVTPTAALQTRPPESRRSARTVVVAALAAVALVAGIAVVASLGEDDEAPDELVGADVSVPDAAGGAGEPVASDASDAPTAATDPPTEDEPDESDVSAATSLTTGPYTLVSVASDGTQADADSANPAISADGRYVAFDSLASNLVAGDSGAHRDVFVHDRETGETTRISEADGIEGDGDSREPWLSADGRYVLFVSTATNLDAGTEDTNGTTDVFLHDRENGQTRLVSTTPDGGQHSLHSIEAHMSDDATLIAYGTFREDELPDGGADSVIFTSWVHDVTAGTTTLLAEFAFSDPSVGVCTRDGPRVAPDASIVVADCSVNGAFVYERESGTVEPISMGYSNLTLTPAPGGDEIFLSAQENWHEPGATRDDTWQLYAYDRPSAEYRLLGELTGEFSLDIMSISSDGRQLSVVWAQKDNMWKDMILVDTTGGTTLSLKDEFDLIADIGPPEDHGGARLDSEASLGAFSYHLDDLVDADANGHSDIFVVTLPG